MSKTLFLDIETRPASVYVFSLFKPVIGMDQIIEPSRIIAISWQWLGSKKTEFMSEFHDGADEMHAKMHEILDEADIVVGYNSKRFDIPWITGELILRGYAPPAPFFHIDLYQSAKQNMRLLSGKLDYLSLRLLDDRKVSHEGFNLWKSCMAGDAKAWARMKKYALKDTALMLPIYDILRPWIKGHPNVALIDGQFEACTKCSSSDLEKRGLKHTGTSSFQQYRCRACGSWSRGSQRVETTALRPA